MKLWKRLLHAVASGRRFVRRITRHMIRIRIENTFRPAVPLPPIPMAPMPVAPMPAAPLWLPPPATVRQSCIICRQHPQMFADDLLCLGCSVALPKSIRAKIPLGLTDPAKLLPLLDQLRPDVHALYAAARDN